MTAEGRHPALDTSISRRGFLLASGALVATACGSTSPEIRPAEPSPVAKSPTVQASPSVPPVPPSSPSPPEQVLPSGRTWSPVDGEIEPQIKVAAARVIEALGTVPAAGSATRRLGQVGAEPDLARQAGALIPPAVPAVVEIVYPQYGGLTGHEASVMAVARQTWLASGREQGRTVTADVRLARTGDDWAVTELRPVEPVDVTALTPSGPAAALAGNTNIALPDAAVADLADGLVDPLVIDMLLQLCESYEMSVTVFRSGHPENVFGSDGISNHTRGRAVDIWAINGMPVVTMNTDDATLLGFLTASREIGSDEIGGPTDPDGPGGVHFANDLHRDHVHIGFDL